MGHAYIRILNKLHYTHMPTLNEIIILRLLFVNTAAEESAVLGAVTRKLLVKPEKT
jgi:hypothetical protein